MTCCWWCCHHITGTTLPLPLEYFPAKDEFKTMGQFCSWSCAKTFTIKRYLSTAKMSEICALITLLRKKTEGKVTPTIPAPDKYILKMFGGPMTIEDFRKECHTPSVEYQLPDYNHAIPAVVNKQRVVPDVKPSELERRLDNIHKASNKNEPLKLKRGKPLKRNIQNNSLEHSLSIKFS